MKIQKVTLRLQLYGIPLSMMFLAEVSETKRDDMWSTSDNKFIYPIGKRIIYTTGRLTETIYLQIPRISVHNLQIKVIDVNLFEKIILDISSKLRKDKFIKPYQIDSEYGVQIQYLFTEPLITPDDKIRTLIHGKTPQQDHIRGILDVIDQLYGYTPRGHVKITFKLTDKSNQYNFYIMQIGTISNYIYDGRFFYFINRDVGKFKYNIITGDIGFELDQVFKIELARQFLLNYHQTLGSDIMINVMAIEADVSMATITYTSPE